MSAQIQILLVEDSPSDQLLAKEALDKSTFSSVLHIVSDGVDAMAYLRGEGKYESAVLPDLILLDLNLPRKDGRQVLAEIKSSEELKRIPVVVLSTSQSEQDLKQAYGLHANCYIAKPVDFQEFKRAVQSVQDFWFHTVSLPNRSIGH